jgi:hypothetical protein
VRSREREVLGGQHRQPGGRIALAVWHAIRFDGGRGGPAV